VPAVDSLRTLALKRFRIKVIRFGNDDVIHNSDGVASHIAEVVEILRRKVKGRTESLYPL
jgi:very-short-patch-repair endonuclease